MVTNPGPGAGVERVEVTPSADSEPRLRLLFVVPFAPRLDSRHGGRVIARLIRALAAGHDVGVVYLAPQPGEPIDPELAACCLLVEEVRVRPEWPTGPWHRRAETIMTPFNGRPSQVSAQYSRRFTRTVRAVARRFDPDVIQIEHDTLAYCAPAVAKLAATTLVCHDPGVQTSIDQASVTTGRQRLAHRMDEAAWRRHWQRTLPRLDAIVAFTGRDADQLRTALPQLEPVVIPLGIEATGVPLSPIGSDGRQVVFVAGYSHPPNSDAALRLITTIMPAVRRAVPDARLVLVGDKPTKRMRSAASPQGVVVGPVDDVTPFLDDAALFVAPIRLGGGMRVKVIEALGAGKAVVASPLAAAGLTLGDDAPLVLAETDAEFATEIVRLLDDPLERARIGAGAYRWATAQPGWAETAREYERLYARLLAAPAR